MRRIGLLGIFAVMFVLASSGLAEEESHWTDGITVFGSIDARIESYWLKYESDTDQTPDDLHENDVFVYRAELGVDVRPNPYVVGRLSYIRDAPDDRDDDPFAGPNEGEAWVSIRYPEIVTPYVIFGRMYLPVGQNDTFGVTDTLVFRLTETWNTSVGVGLSMKWFHIAAHFFNGSFARVNSSGEPDDNLVDTAMVRCDLFPLAFIDRVDMAFGFYWLSDATETQMDLGNLLLTGNYTEQMGLWGFYLRNVARITDMVTIGLVGEMANTAAFRKRNYVDNAGDETGIRAYNIELAALIWQERITVGGRFEAIAGLDWLGTQANDPDYEVTGYSAVSGFVGLTPLSWLSLTLQYRYGWDNESNVDHTVSERLRLEF